MSRLSTVKVNRDFGAVGLSKNQPIDLNDEDAPARNGGDTAAREPLQSAVSDALSDTVRKIAELQVGEIILQCLHID